MVLGLIGALPIAFESVVLADFSADISCSPAPIGPISIAYVLLYAVLYGGLCFVTTIAFLIATVCYIYKNTITDRQITKGLVKLGFFLLVGNSIALIGQFVPPLISALGTGGTREDFAAMNYTYLVELTYTAYTLINTSLIPPTVLVILYFEPLRKTLCSVVDAVFTSVCRRRRFVTISQPTGQVQLSTEHKETENAL